MTGDNSPTAMDRKIKRFDSIHMGVLQTAGDEPAIKDFKSVNIIYGQNYSGKTTLAKIIRALETKSMPINYKEPKFELVLSGGSGQKDSRINQGSLHDFNLPIRVFTQDFISDNLKFLLNEDSREIASFVLGQENNIAQNNIDSLEDALGPESDEGKLRGKSRIAKSAYKKLEELWGKTNADHQGKQTDIARDIKNDPKTGHSTYNKGHLQNEEEELGNDPAKFIKGKDEQQALIETIQQVVKTDDIKSYKPPIDSNDLDAIVTKAKQAIEQEVKISDPLPELEDHKELESWVGKGIEHHAGRDRCAFCSNEITTKRRDALDGHFNDQVQSLQKEIEDIEKQANALKKQLEETQKPGPQEFYRKFQTRAEDCLKELDGAVHSTRTLCENVSQLLEGRKNTISQVGDASAIVKTEVLEHAAKSLNAVINDSNKHKGSIEKERNAASKNYRRHLLATAILKSDYAIRKSKIESMKDELKHRKKALDDAQGEVKSREDEINTLRASMKSENAAVKRINVLLETHFATDNFYIDVNPNKETDQATQAGGFVIKRRGDNMLANNLSEGEKTLLALCYFIARLDAVDDENPSDELPIIWIDDPVSSLDSNHLFSVASMLLNEVRLKSRGDTSKKNCRQVFVTTHNMEFLKFISRGSRWQAPKDYRYGQVFRKGKDKARLRELPGWLKNNVTEYVLLFCQIYQCAEHGSEEYGLGTFGNIVRRFLEAHLYLKFPSDEFKLEAALRCFLKPIDSEHAKRISLLINERSHFACVTQGDQACPEAKIVAKTICTAMEKNDFTQYEHLEKIAQNYNRELSGSPSPS